MSIKTKLVKHLKLKNLTIGIYQSPCIITTPPPNTPTSRALIVPANEELIGTALPYFPMASSPPSLSSSDRHTTMSSNWGGMEAGSSMFYPEQTIDGMVTRLGGTALRDARRRIPVQSDVERVGGGGVPQGGRGMVRCPVGGAVVTSAYGEHLTRSYDTLVHTVPPLFDVVPSSSFRRSQEDDEDDTTQRRLDLLRSCWINSLRLAVVSERCTVVTAPVGLGSGARLAPKLDAIDTATDSVVGFCVTDGGALGDVTETVVVELVVRDDRDVKRVIDGVEKAVAVRGVDCWID